jgi:catechol 2,3-dioxygenase-like lactoylglutathione lyase family enzyme
VARIASNISVLPSRNLDRSAAFYARLGYGLASRVPGYAILRRDGVELHLAEMEVDPARNPSGADLRVTGVDEMARLFGLAAEDKPWGQREFALADPDENLIRVGEPTPA